ncbi:MAG TPA: VWA domain-containing protein [Planctomycetaceae bacterium]|nr:VWA domain-containing protein [Planctomycetaceae bacterium]
MSTAGTELVRPGNLPPIAPADAALNPAHSAVEAATAAGSLPVIPLPTRSEWHAAGVSLMFHLIMLLVLAALLIPVRTVSSGTSIDGGIGNEQGNSGDLLDSVTIGTPEKGTGHDIERSLSPAEGASAVEGAMAGGSGSGSGSGKGSFDAIASLGAAGGGGGKGVGFFGTRARADSVIFIVDMSGSMEGHRFDRAVEELIHSLNLLQPSQKFFIFFYNGVTYPMFEQHNPKLLPATTGNRAKAVKWIKAFHPEGDTAPEDAIERALRLKPQVIYFLTDGEIPNTTRSTAQRFNTEHKTVIHTIAFEYEGGAEQLRGIAADSHGKYRFVP